MPPPAGTSKKNAASKRAMATAKPQKQGAAIPKAEKPRNMSAGKKK